jgi:protein-tyrosine sulfotransferase
MLTNMRRQFLKKFDYKSIALLLSIIALLYSYLNFQNKCKEYLKSNKSLSSINSSNYSRQTPIIFVGGIPRSGTTLMRAMLDAHPLIRCGEETRILPGMIEIFHQMSNKKTEMDRLGEAGITQDISDSALSSYMLEIIVRHGKLSQHLCNKDPFILKYSSFVLKLFPNAKFILMIRDARATVYSIISRKIGVSGFKFDDYRESFRNWNQFMEHMYSECMTVGPTHCLPVYYEQLVIKPEREMKRILQFFDIPWDESVLNHEKYIGNEVEISKFGESSDQVIKPVNMNALSSWVGNIPKDVLDEIETLAPMMLKLGYDIKSDRPIYGDKKV